MVTNLSELECTLERSGLVRENFLVFVALLFVFGNYCPIID